MTEQLKNAKKVVGIKQLRRAIRDHLVTSVFMADDADAWIQDEILSLCQGAGIEPIHVSSMKMLGSACGITIGAAVAAILREAS